MGYSDGDILKVMFISVQYILLDTTILIPLASLLFFPDVQPWDVLLELVRLCTYPVPRNPFEVDFDYFEQLPLQERVLATGAMVNLLQKIICHKKEDKPYLAHGEFLDP